MSSGSRHEVWLHQTISKVSELQLLQAEQNQEFFGGFLGLPFSRFSDMGVAIWMHQASTDLIFRRASHLTASVTPGAEGLPQE